MIVDPAPVHLVLTAAEANQLSEQLADAVKRAYLMRHARPPKLMLAFTDRLRAETEPRRVPAASTSGGVIAALNCGGAGLGTEPEWLTTAEASKHAGISEGYARELCREREVQTSRTAKGAWLISAASLGAWSQCRKERNRESA